MPLENISGAPLFWNFGVDTSDLSTGFDTIKEILSKIIASFEDFGSSSEDAIAKNKKGLQDFAALLNKIGDTSGLTKLIDDFSALYDQEIKLKDALSKTQDPVAVQKLNEELQKTGAQLKAVGEQITNLPKPVDESPQVEKTVKAYTRLRQVRNELAQQRVVIPEGGFKNAENEAIAYQTAILNTNKELALAGKNVAGIAAIKESVRGLVGGFQAVSGAIALFGGNSKEAEEATKAVIGAMGILNGIEEIAALLSKNSAVNFYLEGLAHKANAKSIDEESAALLKKNVVAGVTQNTEVKKTVIQEVKNVKENLPVDISTGEALNSAAVAKNTAVTKAATLANKEIAASKVASTVSTTAETAAIEVNSTAQKVQLLDAQGNVIVKEAQVVANTELVVTNTAVAESQTAVNAAMLANPVGIILASLVALFAAYELYIHTIGRATDAEKERKAAAEALKEIQDKSVADIAKESESLEHLIATAKSEVLTRKQKQDAINEAIEKNPEYLSGLNLENLSTREGIELIKKQTELIRNRGLVKASSSVVDEKLQAQVKAQNELNDVIRKGEELSHEAATTEEVAQDQKDKLQHATINLTEATEAANGAIETQNKLTDDLGKSFQTDAEKIKLYIEQLDNIISRSFGVEKALAQQQKSLAQLKAPVFQQQEVKPFVEKDFDAKTKNELQQQQAFIDGLSIAGTKKQISMRRDLLHEEYDQNLKDPRIFNQVTGKPVPGAEGEAAAAHAKFLKGQHDLNLEAQAIDNKSAISNAEALAIHLQAIGLEGTKRFYDARVAAIKQGAAVALAQEGITAGEVERIRAQMELDLANLSIDFQKKQLENDKAAIQARLNAVKAGSAEEFNLRISLIDKSLEAELKTLGLSAEKKKEFQAKADKDARDLTNKFLFDGIKDRLSIETLEIQASLDVVAKGSKLELDLNKQKLQQKAADETFAIEISLDGEKLKAAKIFEINQKLLADQQKLNDEFFAIQLQKQLTAIDQATAERKQTNSQVINNPFSSGVDKFNAEKDNIDADLTDTIVKKDHLESDLLRQRSELVRNLVAEAKLEADIKVAENKIKELQNQKTNKTSQQQIFDLTETAKNIQTLTTAFSSLAGVLKDVDGGLSEIIGSLAKVGAAAVSALSSVAQIKKGQSEKGFTGIADIAGGAAGLAGSFFSVVGVIQGIINKAAEARRQQRIAQDQDQVNIIQGEIAVNDEYRKRLLIQSQINKLKIEGLRAEADALAKNKSSTASDFADILSRIQALKSFDVNKAKTFPDGSIQLANGTVIPASQVATFGDLSGKSFDDLEKLFLTGQLEGKAKDLFTTLEKLKQEGVDIDAAIEQNKEKAKELFTGTTADNIVNSIADGFSQGFKSVQDFATKTEDIIRGALLSALKTKALEGPIKKIFDQFAADAESGGGLDQSEIAKFNNSINQTIKDAEAFAEQIQKATGINLAAATGNTNSLQGSIKKELTEQTGTILAGSVNGLRLTGIEQLASINRSLTTLNKIEANTAAALTIMSKYYSKWDLTGIKVI